MNIYYIHKCPIISAICIHNKRPSIVYKSTISVIKDKVLSTNKEDK